MLKIAVDEKYLLGYEIGGAVDCLGREELEREEGVSTLDALAHLLHQVLRRRRSW